MTLNRLAMPSNVNDNARETLARSISPSDEAEPAGDAPDRVDRDARAEATDLVPRARPRGPLVTRWIGFAARRRQAQARVGRMQERWNEIASERQAH